MKDIIKSPSLDTGIDITKMHGHMDIYLTDVKTGKVEEVHEDNMMTNAMQEFFKNLGFLNYPNVNQNNMVEELLGGVMGFDSLIDENANIVRVPAGCKMTFNGSIGVLNNSVPTELGSYSADESGWQDDGSYVQTYDYTTSQANGTINCVCLTGKNFAYVGEGNSISDTAHNTKWTKRNLQGTLTSYSGYVGTVFNINLSDSSFYTFRIETVEVEGESVSKGVIRKYRVPISKINIKGTQSNLIVLSKQEISLSETFLNATSKLYQPCNGNLLIWNNIPNEDTAWGTNFTQYLWTLTPSGNLTVETVTNNSGVPLLCLGPAYFEGNYCFIPNNFISITSPYIATDKIIVWNRSNNLMSVITIANTKNWWNALVRFNDWRYSNSDGGWVISSSSGDGRRIVTSRTTYNEYGYFRPPMVYDAVNLTGYPINCDDTNYYSNSGDLNFYPVSGLIRHKGMSLYRDQCYIATINNLDNPVVKTSDKTMKVVYRITFDEQ